ncbi:MAG: response regulator transcription factor [Lachnospiraceae bacterium]|nr:response regulator transcription factor [Lachnospiraceae bacterium]MCI8871982.1 response regulator transcription factor [Lachnospiraceae bacterium]MCI9058441.1 response regulator transcription factor [Lachnospiraceae bacterium]GFI29297.1 transcriptional regulatory protein YpdB [Lachnospiraceae bacterium]
MRIGICDDQKEIREILTDKVKKYYPAEDIAVYSSGEELLAARKLPDILFLDVQMPEKDGMETARELRKRDRQMIIIFVTVTEDYVFQSFDVGAFHYLIKPLEEEKFEEVLQKAVRQVRERDSEDAGTGKERQSLIVTSKGQHITVPVQEIVYAEVFNRKIILHTMDADIEYYGKLKELEKKAGEDFYRPHRAYLINLNFVRKYNAGAIYLKRGQALVAKQNYHDFVKCYLRFNQRKGKG